MRTVTSAEFQKHFGTYKDAAMREPVAITSHGRDSLVVLSADEYERLKAMDTRRAYRTEDIPEDMLEALMSAKAPEWTSKYNHELDE